MTTRTTASTRLADVPDEAFSNCLRLRCSAIGKAREDNCYAYSAFHIHSFEREKYLIHSRFSLRLK